MTDLERIARILCEADGCDPDALVYDIPLPHDRRGRIMVPIFTPVATWNHYIFMVRTTLEAVMTGAEHTDMHAMLQDILDGGEVLNADDVVEEAPTPPQKKDWRVIYGLKHEGS